MAKNPKAKFRKNDVVLHTEQKKMLIVNGKTFMDGKGWLYTLRVVNGPDSNDYKRYYEDKLESNCDKVKNAKAVKILYGQK